VTKTRALLIIAAIVVGVFVIGAALIPILTRDSRESARVEGPVRSVVVDSERGAVLVRAGEAGGATVAQHRKWILVGPEVDVDLTDGVLRVDVSCPALSVASCSADLDLAVPEDVAVDVKTVRGHLDVRGVRGTVKAVSEDGDVTVDAPSERVTAAAITGTVDVRTPVSPVTVTAQSETHDVIVRVPPGDYRLALFSGVGSTSVVGVTDDRTAPRSLTARSGSGDVRVTGETPAGG
jgi:hypothetical protein